jgi:RNA polymerase sigma-70 factor, ECF subfamily
MDLEKSDNERFWIQELKRGIQSAMTPLMDQYGQALMRYLVSILSSRDSAEDVFQDTWIKVLEKIGSFQNEASFAPWLFRIARNTAYDHLRGKKRWWQLDWMRKTGDEEVPPLELKVEDHFREAVSNRDTTDKLMSALPPEHREIISMRFYQDMSYEEIASICRLPLGTVKSRLKRALDKAADAYSHLEGCHV